MRLLAFAFAMLLAACASAPADKAPADKPATAGAKAACVPPPTKQVVQEIAPGSGDPVTFRTAVLVGYTGWLYDPCAPEQKGLMFDTTEGRATPMGIVIGAGRVVPGLDEALIGMRENGKARVVVPPDKAYGEKGKPDNTVPPNATLVYELEVLRVIVRPPAPAPAK
jgi:FKBP-type peptidyl-prolyl cis-trans isomerase FkpA